MRNYTFWASSFIKLNLTTFSNHTLLLQYVCLCSLSDHFLFFRFCVFLEPCMHVFDFYHYDYFYWLIEYCSKIMSRRKLIIKTSRPIVNTNHLIMILVNFYVIDGLFFNAIARQMKFLSSILFRSLLLKMTLK